LYQYSLFVNILIDRMYTGISIGVGLKYRRIGVITLEESSKISSFRLTPAQYQHPENRQNLGREYEVKI